MLKMLTKNINRVESHLLINSLKDTNYVENINQKC